MKYSISRKPGNFIDPETGNRIEREFTGTVREWYEYLFLTVADLSKKYFNTNEVLSADVSPEVFTMHQCCMFYMPANFDDVFCEKGRFANKYNVNLVREQPTKIITVYQPGNLDRLEFEIFDIEIN